MKVHPCTRRLLSGDVYKVQALMSSFTSFPKFVSVFGINERFAGPVPFDDAGVSPGFLDLRGFKTPNN